MWHVNIHDTSMSDCMKNPTTETPASGCMMRSILRNTIVRHVTGFLSVNALQMVSSSRQYNNVR